MTYPGVYRAIVVNNNDIGVDDRQLGRIQIDAPHIYGDNVPDAKLPWAWPVFPYGGGRHENDEGTMEGYGMVAIPPIGASVWIMFEHGDPKFPVWMGTWYGARNADPETPDEAIEDPETGAVYPDIFLIKMPWRKDGMFIRICRDRRMEMVFEKDEKYIRMDAVEGRVSVNAGDWSLDMQSEGHISIHGNTINIKADTAVTVESDGNAIVKGKNQAQVHSDENTVISSRRQVQGRGPRVSGFDRRDN